MRLWLAHCVTCLRDGGSQLHGRSAVGVEHYAHAVRAYLRVDRADARNSFESLGNFGDAGDIEDGCEL